MGEIQTPLVSICSITYNHAPFIRQCLDGMLMQQRNFDYEIIINDDCSTDGTTEIIREYAARHPDIIRPIYHEENEYSKGVRGMFAKYVYPKARGKYIALCEGDDYWTDPLKLQKQVDFMEAHPEYSMCFHNAMIKWEKGEHSDGLFATLETRDYTGVEMYEGWIVPTASAVIKKDVILSPLYQRAVACPHFTYGDILVWLSAAAMGAVRCMNDVMSVYRKHEGGAIFSYDYPAIKRHIIHNSRVPVFFGSVYKIKSQQIVFSNVRSSVLYYFSSHEYLKSWSFICILIKFCPFLIFKRLVVYVLKRAKKVIKHDSV